MKNNRYAQHKMEIKAIAERENADIGVACAMLRQEMDWFENEKDPEITEFCSYVHSMTSAETIAYFGG